MRSVRVVRGRPLFYKTKELENAENLYLQYLKFYTPEKPLDGALGLKIKFTFPFNDGESKKVVAEGLETPKTTHPDLDNMEKLLIDCLQKAGIIANDSRIFLKVTAKTYGSNPSIEILINEVSGFFKLKQYYLRFIAFFSTPFFKKRKAKDVE